MSSIMQGVHTAVERGRPGRTPAHEAGKYSHNPSHEIATCTICGGEMAFNAQYLIDGIQGAQGDEILLEFNGSVNPGLIKAEGDKNYMYLVMPIRIS